MYSEYTLGMNTLAKNSNIEPTSHDLHRCGETVSRGFPGRLNASIGGGDAAAQCSMGTAAILRQKMGKVRSHSCQVRQTKLPASAYLQDCLIFLLLHASIHNQKKPEHPLRNENADFSGGRFQGCRTQPLKNNCCAGALIPLLF